MSTASALALKNRRHFVNSFRLLRGQSTFKMIFVTCFAVACEVGLFWFFLDGFEYLDRMGGIGIMIIDRLFSLFFFGMELMLVLSGIVTAYATIFRSDEVPFLLTRPFEISEIVRYKFTESTYLSSWAFSFVIIPFIGSYAWHQQVTVLLAFWTLLFSIPFLFICSGIGTLITLIFVRWSPGAKFLKFLGVLFAVGFFALFFVLSREAYNLSTDLQLNLARIVPGLTLAANPLLPSWWISEGITAMSRHEWFRGGMFFGLVLSTAMVIYMAVEQIGKLVFLDAWQRMIYSGGVERREPLLLAQLDRRLSVILPPDVRGIIMKDIRAFLRDPMQWSQVLIFFGLLALYFSNLRSFHYQGLAPNWRNTIAFLNVFSVSAVMCSLSSRFIYPQLSLEGQGFWIIGLSPVTMTKILVTKFLLALTCMLAVSVTLMTISVNMLGASFSSKIVATSLVCAMSFAVCGLSTGLGAIFLDLNQRNPAAIVSGFGGTLNLVLSLAFMLSAILPFGFVFHLHTINRLTGAELNRGLIVAGAWLIVATAVTTFMPLWLGIKSLRRREF